MLTGGCHCGSVRYETADAPFDPCVGNMLGLTVPVFDAATLDP